MAELREIAQAIADVVRDDPVLREDGKVTVVVEDKAVVGVEIQKALAVSGVCVLVAVTGFRRDDRSPVLQGNVELQISCYEHPVLNRDDLSTMTAQGVAERIAQVLHYAILPELVGQVIFKDMARDDVDVANIVRANYEAQAHIGEGND